MGEVFLIEEPAREVLDRLDDFSYHFFGRFAFQTESSSGEEPRLLQSVEALPRLDSPYSPRPW
jgi:hypothetical protein